ncbi:MAG: RNA-binding cell elongation regulator Jag/EloR [Desulfobacterales bacterium]|jgi:spoIIIJ-associated protein
MPAPLEFKAKNVEKAVEKASAELKMPKKEIKYEVLSYGSSGIFGLSGTKKAKIRVMLPEELLANEPQAEVAVFSHETLPESDASGNSKAAGTMVINGQDEVAKKNSERQPFYSATDDSVENGRLVLQRILDALTSEAKISVNTDADRLCFNVNGGNAGILIGKRGQTRDAIQTIVEKVVNKRNNNRIRVLVDIEGYLETRKENLESMAFRLAEKAKKIGKPISLGHMNAYDRRIVHIALKDFPEVLTRSRGEGRLRKLVIFPKKSRNSRR